MVSVLQVITDTDRRGAQIVATELGEELQARGYDLRTRALASGGPGARLAVPTLGDRRLGWPTIRALRRASRGVDVVVAHGSTTLPASVIAMRGRRVPIVYRSIGDPAYWAPSFAKRMRMRLLLTRANAVVTVWDGAAQQLRSLGVREDRITVIPQWVDVERYVPMPDAERARARAWIGVRADMPVVGVVGALSAEKDVQLALEAASRAGAFVVVVGDGPMRGALEGHAASRLPLRSRFTGSIDRPRDVLAGIDVLALTSRTEGMPAVVLEAAAMGIPVVAPAVGSLPGLAREGVVTELVEVREPSAFARAFARAWEPDAERRARARAAAVDHYSIEVLMPRWEGVFRRIVGDAAERLQRDRTETP